MNLQHLSEKYGIGIETLQDIIKELQAPGHDPRDDLDPPTFSSNVMDIKDLAIWTILEWVVRNITDFGAFVDIGLHNDGLVHKSQMADRFVSHPMDVVHLWQQVSVRVLEIDLEREKVSLSMKTTANLVAPHSARKIEVDGAMIKAVEKQQKADTTASESTIKSTIKRS